MTFYMTQMSADALGKELKDLRSVQRPKIVGEVSAAAAQGDRSENAEYIYGKKKLREIDRRIRYLVKRLNDATIIEPSHRKGETRVFFGAKVSLEFEDESIKEYTLVGEDEIDAKSGKISYKSPLGISLLKKTVGDSFVFQRPKGPIEVTILSVSYE